MQGVAVRCLSSHWVVMPALSEATSQSQLSEKMLERETCHPQGFCLLCLSPCLEVSISHLALGLHLPLSLSTQIKKSHIFCEDPCQAPQDIYCFLNLNCLASCVSYIADVLESWWHVDGTWLLLMTDFLLFDFSLSFRSSLRKEVWFLVFVFFFSEILSVVSATPITKKHVVKNPKYYSWKEFKIISYILSFYNGETKVHSKENTLTKDEPIFLPPYPALFFNTVHNIQVLLQWGAFSSQYSSLFNIYEKLSHF